MTYDINKIFNKLKMHDGVNRIIDEIEEMREKEKLYILSIDDLTQTVIVVNKKNIFMLIKLEQIIDDDRTSYVTPTQKEKHLLHLKFIKDASYHGLLIGKNGSIYKKVKDVKEIDRAIHKCILRYSKKVDRYVCEYILKYGGKIYEDTNKRTRP